MSDAISELSALLHETSGLQPKKLDEVYDMLKLLGVVIGQAALLDIAAGTGDEKARVSAARALISLKEDPATITERLRNSAFADLTVDQLRGIVDGVKRGETDLAKLIQEAKVGTHGLLKRSQSATP